MYREYNKQSSNLPTPMAADPKYATAATTTTAAAASRPISQPPPPQQPIGGENHPLLYPVSSSGRGFIPKPLGPIDLSSSSPLLSYSRSVRAHFDYLNHTNITTRHHYPHLHAPSPPIKPLPVSPHPHPKGLNIVVKPSRILCFDCVSSCCSLPSISQASLRLIFGDAFQSFPSPFFLHLLSASPGSAVSDSISNGYKDTSAREAEMILVTSLLIRGRKAAPGSAVSDSNGYKDASTRDRSRDDSYYIIRDRKVRITEDASLYALCRSWLRNGVNEENQLQQKDVMKALPKPLPASMVASCMSRNKEDEKHDNEHEENEESVEHLSPQDLLKKHIKRARKVRARLREERLQRITRYRSRLRLLLPPPVEPFRNDTAAGN